MKQLICIILVDTVDTAMKNSGTMAMDWVTATGEILIKVKI